jgi:redox-sensing transcriptional repressor
LLKKKGQTHVSSTQIAKKINVSSTQIAKDLSYVKVAGKTRVGYEIEVLIDVLEQFLGFTSQHRAVVLGVGSLGGALLSDSGLEQFGLKVFAGFDVNDKVIGTKINDISVYDIEDFAKHNKTINADIAILTVPPDNAQEIADFAIQNGIRAIWNFTPFRIRVPEHIVLQNTSLYAHLAVMFNRLSVNASDDSKK